jgi:hypothetical protein
MIFPASFPPGQFLRSLLVWRNSRDCGPTHAQQSWNSRPNTTPYAGPRAEISATKLLAEPQASFDPRALSTLHAVHHLMTISRCDIESERVIRLLRYRERSSFDSIARGVSLLNAYYSLCQFLWLFNKYRENTPARPARS